MPSTWRIHSLLVLASIFFAAGPVHAEAGQWGQSKVRYASRSMILDRGTLRVDLGPQDFAMLNSGLINNGRGLRIFDAGDDVGLYHGAGASVGILDNLEAGALLFPLLFAPEFEFGAIEGYARYRLLRKARVEVGVQAGLQLGTGNYGYGAGRLAGGVAGSIIRGAEVDFATSGGIVVLLRPSPMVRIDTGAELELYVWDRFPLSRHGSELHANLDLPFAVNVNVTENLFFGGKFGMLFPTQDLDYFSIGLGIQGGYTLAEGVADITGWLTWDQLFTPGVPDGVDSVHGDGWQIGAGANLYVGIFD
ncbi:MAG: hypothetical protein H6714_02815 [Myxococcales bacterium]|nr:hypothetical protein [Myxococcales bacterium]